MKKQQSTFLFIYILFSILSFNVELFAYDFIVDNIAYTKPYPQSKDVWVSSHERDSIEGVVKIPDRVVYDNETYRVTYIGLYAFSHNKKITSVEIPYTVNSIDAWAFQGLTELDSIILPSSIIGLGRDIFADCTNLSYVKYPIL